jgi:hypothetical protein
LRSTPRFGFAGVPNALNLDVNLLRLLEVSLVLASWRVVLHCSWRNAPSALRLACCARGRVVLYRSRGRPPSPPSPLRSASPLRLAFICALALCVYHSRGRPPNDSSPLRSASPQRFVIFCARACCGACVCACHVRCVCVCVCAVINPPSQVSLSLRYSHIF